MTDLEKKSYFYLVFHVVYKSVGRNREIYTGLCCFSAMITSFQAKVNDLRENAPFCSNECMYISHGICIIFNCHFIHIKRNEH